MDCFLEMFLQEYIDFILNSQLLIPILESNNLKQFFTHEFNLHIALDRWPQVFKYLINQNITALLEIIKEAVIMAQDRVQQKKQYNQCLVKDRFEIILQQIPAIKQFYLKSLSDIQVDHMHNLVLVQGTVVRTGEVKSMTVQCQIKCEDCQNISTIKSDMSDMYRLQIPGQCQHLVNKKNNNNFFKMLIQKHFNKNQNRGGSNRNQGKRKQKPIICGSKNIALLEGSQRLIDFQEIKIQDTLSRQSEQNNKRSVKVVLFGNHVNHCRAGDDIIVGGVVVPMWVKVQKAQRPTIQIAIKCLQIDQMNKIKTIQSVPANVNSNECSKINDYLTRKQLLSSTCPNLYQRYDVKLGVLLCIVGGVISQIDNTQIRGNSHMLLIGEPGTGKSSVLKQIQELSNRSIYINGIGCTQAGLTVSYLRDGSDWIIEAGALVLADQGVCCIDEFNLIQKQQVDSILEVLEQQTVSVQKAGQATKLNARTTLIAACNPVGFGQRYQNSYSLEENTGISSPMMSRFDLVFILTDDQCNDQESSDFVLGKVHMNNINIFNQYISEEQPSQGNDLMSKQELRDYLQKAKQDIKPQVTQQAHYLIQKYYVKLRQKHQRITIRSLESIIRLSQAHSKLMMRDEVTENDVLSVLSLLENSGGSGLGLVGNQWGQDDFQEFTKSLQNIKLELELN